VINDEAQRFVDEASGEAPVRGFLRRAESSRDGFLVLTHGAGGNCNAPLLLALADKFAASGFSTLRCDLPFRQRRPHGPPSPSDAKHDQDGLRRAVELMKKQFAGRAVLGGVSYGGRQASMLVAAEPTLVEGLLLLSYPLHLPGRPAQLRTAHFPSLRTPILFVSGTRDAFGSIAELESAIKLIPAPTKLVPIEGAGHSLLQKSNREKLPETVVREFLTFFSHPFAKRGQKDGAP
jgi:predicted alpha/beta-hydrolase family hydrolase